MQNPIKINNFLLRLITALIAIPLVLALIIKTSDKAFLNISLLILSFCIFEWCKLVDLKGALIWSFLSINLFLVYLFSDLSQQTHSIYMSFFNNYLLPIINLFWLVALLVIIFYNNKLYKMKDKLLKKFKAHRGRHIIISFILGLLVITPSFVCLNYLKNINGLGYLHIIFLLILVWAVDTGAYIAGKLFGGHKLIKNVSPGKTIEGAVGGLVSLYICALILYYNFSLLNHTLSLIPWLLINLAIYLAALTGDLLISLIKRIVLVKDTGSLLPGHGGILDRLDSFFSAMPVFFYFLMYHSYYF